MKATLYTLGCKVNQYETEVMTEQLEKNGFEITGTDSPADIYIVNSCTVTAESDRKSRQSVRHLKKLNPDAIVVLTGCMPQAFPEQAQELFQADIVLGNKNNHLLIPAINEFIETRHRVIKTEPHLSGESFRPCAISSFAGRTRATLKIEDGCNRFCSYCIIPFARGRVRSKPLVEIEKELKSLEKSGFGEVVLVGINLSAYGSDIGKSICDAVELCNSLEGIKRVRLGSLEPDHLTDEVIERLAHSKKLCPQFHISLQSGCDSTLKRMNRHYCAEEYSALCRKLRATFPDTSLTTDVMVGFAGETDDEFKQSLEFVKSIGFEKVHVFPYSQRKGTRAAEFPDQVTKAEKENRSRIMAATAEKLRFDFLLSQVGKTVEVLFEDYSVGASSGYTANYTPVRVFTGKPLSGFTSVKIVGAEKDFCIGEPG